MRLHQPLDDLLQSKSHVRVLRALGELPEGMGAGVRDLGRRAGITHPAAGRILRSLEEQGIVRIQRLGRTDAYRLNTAHIFYAVLRDLFSEERRTREKLIEVLRRELPRHLGHIEGATLFGSAARGDMEPASDIDVAVVIRRASPRDLAAADEQLGELIRAEFGNQLNLHLLNLPANERSDSALRRSIAREGVPIFAPRRTRGAA